MTSSSPTIGIPTLTYPSSGYGFNQYTSFSFQWSSVSNADSYELNLCYSSSFVGSISVLNSCSNYFYGSNGYNYSNTTNTYFQNKTGQRANTLILQKTY